MNKNLLIILGLFFSSITFSQDKETELYFSADANFSNGNYKEAIANYTELLKIADKNRKTLIKRCYYMRGFSWDRIQEYDNAISDFTNAIRIDNTDMASFIDRGMSNYNAGYFKEAKADFHHVISDKTNTRMTNNAYYWLAKIFFSEGNFSTSKTYLNFFIKGNSNNTEVYFLRGVVNDRLMNFKASIKDYTKTIELSPKNYQAFANRGTAKINLLTGSGNLQPTKRETKSACKDLKKARKLGDNTVGDLIYVYCDKKINN